MTAVQIVQILQTPIGNMMITVNDPVVLQERQWIADRCHALARSGESFTDSSLRARVDWLNEKVLNETTRPVVGPSTPI